MPSRVLKGKSPIPVLKPDVIPFSIYPRLFGCVSFVHDLSSHNEKMIAKSKKCIFFFK